jgi:hypothetical protein
VRSQAGGQAVGVLAAVVRDQIASRQRR